MCGGIHYGEIVGPVSVERWSCSKGASCVVECTMGRLRDWSLYGGGLVAEVLNVWWNTRRLSVWSLAAQSSVDLSLHQWPLS